MKVVNENDKTISSQNLDGTVEVSILCRKKFILSNSRWTSFPSLEKCGILASYM